jgi:hypothetical protein
MIAIVSNRSLIYLLAIDGTELLEVIQSDIKTKKMEHNVLKSTSVTVGENETVAVSPVRVLGVDLDELGEQGLGHGSTTHRSTYKTSYLSASITRSLMIEIHLLTRVTRVSTMDNIGGEGTDGVDGSSLNSINHFYCVKRG